MPAFGAPSRRRLAILAALLALALSAAGLYLRGRSSAAKAGPVPPAAEARP